MTDQLEHDLRTMLTDRAASITTDHAVGEGAIADRLRAGDHALAEVVPLRSAPARGRVLAVAAAVLFLVLVVGAGLWVRGGDDAGPSQSPTTLLPAGHEGSRLTLVGVDEVVDCSVFETATEPIYLTLITGECVRIGSEVRGDLVIGSVRAIPVVPDPGPHDLWNVEITFSDAGTSLTRGLAHACSRRDDGCRDGRIVVLIDDRVMEVLRPTDSRFFEDDRLTLSKDDGEIESRTLARDLNASIGNPPPGVIVEEPRDLTVGDADDSPRDVAERVMDELLGDPSVATEAHDEGSVTILTLETSTGAEVVATVEHDAEAGANRLTRLVSPGITTDLTADGELYAELPDAGTLRVRGFTADQTGEVDATPPGGTDVGAGRVGPLPQPADDYVWLVLRLETADGEVLWSFSRR